MTSPISLLAQNKKIIPITFSRGALQTTHLRLPHIVFTNGHTHPVTIEQVEVRCAGGGTELVTYRIPMARLNEAIKETTKTIQALSQAAVTRDKMGKIYGELTIDPADLSPDPLPGRPVVLPIAELVFVEYTGFARIESMDFEVRYDSHGVQESATLSVPVTHYRCRGKYTFPFRQRDQLFHTDNPVSITGHRTCRAEEFAVDMVAARQSNGGGLVTRIEGATTHVRDYLIYGAEVHAIGEGVVTRVSNLFPDALLDTIDEDYPTRKAQAVYEMSNKVGCWASDGNYVVIDHENGEFSHYCHLKENSISVQAGERVHQGQVIGRVGNTGNSSVPHLHLHLMDGPVEAKANGLPILFQDIDPEQINDEVGENCNTLMFSPYLYFTLGKG